MQQHGHRTAPLQIVQFLKEVPQKKLSDIVNFLKSLEIWSLTKHHVSNDANENAWFLSNLFYMSARKWYKAKRYTSNCLFK
jgi:hypothetical protein